jgi:dolichol-phosphate mannosyltransferase
MNDCELSVVVPVYNEEEVVAETAKRLHAVLAPLGISYELVFVNDGSRDATLSILDGLAAADSHIRILDLSRNFGHQAAISAGMDESWGRAVAVIDADLQDPPELIPAMLEKWREGWDVVYGQRRSREGESWFKKASAAIFYRFLRSMTAVDIPVDTGDFRLMDRAVVEVMRGLHEQNRFVRGLVAWSGFHQTPLPYERAARFAGVTKYPLRKMVRFAIDAVVGFSFKPLKIASWLGFLLSFGSFAYLIGVIVQRLFFADTTTPGWASMLAVSLFFNGVVLVILGIMGEYLGRIYDETKRRPLYVIRRPRQPRA